MVKVRERPTQLKLVANIFKRRTDPVRKSEVDLDQRVRLLTFDDKKAITMTEVTAYVALAQLIRHGVGRESETDVLNNRKLRHETRRAKPNTDRKAFENAKERGRYPSQVRRCIWKLHGSWIRKRQRMQFRLEGMDRGPLFAVKTIVIQKIIKAVSKRIGVPVKSMCSASRRSAIVRARWVTMYIIRKERPHLPNPQSRSPKKRPRRLKKHARPQNKTP